MDRLVKNSASRKHVFLHVVGGCGHHPGLLRGTHNRKISKCDLPMLVFTLQTNASATLLAVKTCIRLYLES